MKRVICFFALAALALLATDPLVPRKASDIGIQTGPDKYIWLSQYSGKTCVLTFILTGCSHCQFTTGILNRIQNDLRRAGRAGDRFGDRTHVIAQYRRFPEAFFAGFSGWI